jgi:hypothetical protein
MRGGYVIPAQGHPAKYYFAGTPQAGIPAKKVTARLHEAPAFAGATDPCGCGRHE